MSTGSERVLEQFDRHLKKGDIFAAPRPGEPDVFGRRRLSASPAFVVFVNNARNVVDRTRNRVRIQRERP
jgi:hypothetical protein